jgi:exoribonuclease-2
MLQRGLQPDFPPAAISQTDKITAPAKATDASVKDLRHLLWASIDNDDSRDLDQLSVAESLPDGSTKIFVAIADVDALVKKNTAIDLHALKNTTSVYTAGEIFPMLPEKLSTNLTSLAEKEERLAIVVEMTVAEDGQVTSSDIYQALVFNHAQLAYNALALWLEGTGPAPEKLEAVPGLAEQLHLQDKATQALRQIRHQHGALQLETAEARAVFEDDVLMDLRPEERNRAKDIIEDFMVAANGVTAKFLEKNNYASLRRVLRTPKRWDKIVQLAAALGHQLPATPNAAALDVFLDVRRKAEPSTFPDLSLSVVKLLGSGEYALELPGEDVEGHFGLAVRDYTHSTAPNRRYPDLITQRLLKAALAKEPSPYTNDELVVMAMHCTEQEDNAQKVERQVRKSAAALLLARRIGEHFDAIVTGASEKGTWVRITNPVVEGMLVRGITGLDVADHIRVRLIRTDVEHGFIDFERIGTKG